MAVLIFLNVLTNRNNNYHHLFKILVIEVAPKISPDTPKKYKVRKGEDVEIVVKFSATPKPNDEWTVNGHVVTKSKRVMPLIDEESAVLTIRKIQEEDVGDYTLKLVNNVGEASIEINVVIVREYPMFLFFFSSSFEIKIKQSCVFIEKFCFYVICLFLFLYIYLQRYQVHLEHQNHWK